MLKASVPQKIAMRACPILCVLALIAAGSLARADIQIGDAIELRQDIRVVGNREVDLGPIHQWLLDPTGERPLKHWKDIQVFNIKENIAGLIRCVVQFEESPGFSEILIKNLPEEVRSYFIVLNRQAAVIARLAAEVAAQEAYAKRLDAVNPQEGRIAVATRNADGSVVYLETPALTRGRAEANLAQVEVGEKRELLAKLEAEHPDWRAQGNTRTRILAMFTGAKYTNLEVWDCGTPKSSPR